MTKQLLTIHFAHCFRIVHALVGSESGFKKKVEEKGAKFCFPPQYLGIFAVFRVNIGVSCHQFFAIVTLVTLYSKWTPPEDQFASLDFFTKKCRY